MTEEVTVWKAVGRWALLFLLAWILGACAAYMYPPVVHAEEIELIEQAATTSDIECIVVEETTEQTQIFTITDEEYITEIHFRIRKSSSLTSPSNAFGITIIDADTHETLDTKLEHGFNELTTSFQDFTFHTNYPIPVEENMRIQVGFILFGTVFPTNTLRLELNSDGDSYTDGQGLCERTPDTTEDFKWQLWGERQMNFRAFWDMPWLPTVHASTTCDYVTKKKVGADWATTTATCSDPIINLTQASSSSVVIQNDLTRNTFYLFVTFIGMVFFVLWYMRGGESP